MILLETYFFPSYIASDTEQLKNAITNSVQLLSNTVNNMGTGDRARHIDLWGSLGGGNDLRCDPTIFITWNCSYSPCLKSIHGFLRQRNNMQFMKTFTVGGAPLIFSENRRKRTWRLQWVTVVFEAGDEDRVLPPPLPREPTRRSLVHVHCIVCSGFAAWQVRRVQTARHLANERDATC